MARNLLHIAFITLCLTSVSAKSLVSVTKSTENGFHVEIRFPKDLTPDQAPNIGLSSVDSTHLPQLSRLFAAPKDAKITYRIRKSEFIEIRPFEWKGKSPEALASLHASGILRGVTAFTLTVYPYTYDESEETLRLYTKLDLEVSFSKTQKPIKTPQHETLGIHRCFLNSEWANRFSITRPISKLVSSQEWFISDQPWIRMTVNQDGLFAINKRWLAQFTDINSINPKKLRLFFMGKEQRLYVSGELDEKFDEEDYVLFFGKYRRGERNHESIWGPSSTYWLTWGDENGMRYVDRDVSPTLDYPETTSFWTTLHFERDLIFDALGEAPDNLRDHWFWTLNNRPITATKSDIPSAAEFPGDVPFPDLEKDYFADIRVAMHGASNLKHHTVLKFNARHVLTDTIWGDAGNGMINFVSAAKIKSSKIIEGRNRVLVQLYADQAKFDLMWFNWFELDYYRRFVATNGYLEATHRPSSGHRIKVKGFHHDELAIFNTSNGTRLTEFQKIADKESVSILFDDLVTTDAHYVFSDSSAWREPTGENVSLRNWTDFDISDYLIISHPDLVHQADILAKHRTASGEYATVISSQTIYDSFNFGHIDPSAIETFLRFAYSQWPTPPNYVLFLGDDTWDYRNILGGGFPAVVPSLYYQSRGRGLAPSDYLFSLLDGNDLLPDLSIGRLAASNQREATIAINKIIAYDQNKSYESWQNRAIYVANFHPKNIFSTPSDSLIQRYTNPANLQAIRIYNPDETPLPNITGKTFVDELNRGALLLNFNGHGSPGTMQSLFTLSLPDWGYLGQIKNAEKLPLILALSCLNGLFSNPVIEGLAETFVNLKGGGAIAYISASAKSYVAQNNLLSDRFYNALLQTDDVPWGQALNQAKAEVLAAHPSWIDAVLTMQLVGDPAQHLVRPQKSDYAIKNIYSNIDTIRSGDVARLTAELTNVGRAEKDSLNIYWVLRNKQQEVMDTLNTETIEAFTGNQTVNHVWTIGDLLGQYEIDVQIKPQEQNTYSNRLIYPITIYEPSVPELIFPADNASVVSDSIFMELIVPHSTYQCEIEYSTTPSFENAIRSPPLHASGSFVSFKPTLYPETAYFWRARLLTEKSIGPWSQTSGFFTSSGPIWSQQGIQLWEPNQSPLDLQNDKLTLSQKPSPLRINEATREDGFTVRDHAGSGIVVTDGTWLYAKRWYNDQSTIYPGTDYFTRIGTGLNGTFRTGNFGVFGDSTTAGISSTYHSDGFIYNESGKAYELERLSIMTGRLDTIVVPSGLLEWKSGLIKNGHSLITSDGEYIYNVSMSTAQGIRNGWGVRVFDPSDKWRLIREFSSPPTANGFTFEWTDGIIADGDYLYFIEWLGEQRIRIVDAKDGSFVTEWKSDQDVTRVISGQYDWVNKKVWLGDLLSSAIFRYEGVKSLNQAEKTTPPIGPSLEWENVFIDGNNLVIEILTLQNGKWIPLDDWVNLEPGLVSLATINADSHPFLKIRAQFNKADATLNKWSAEFKRRNEFQITQAEGYPSIMGLRLNVSLRNLSQDTSSNAYLTIEQEDGKVLRQVPVPSFRRGETRNVTLDSIGIPEQNMDLYAYLAGETIDGDPSDNRLKITLFIENRLPIFFKLWPNEVPFLHGDPLLKNQGLLVSSPELYGSQIEVSIDGQPIKPDSTFKTSSSRTYLLFRPSLKAGTHTLEANLTKDGTLFGNAKISFYADEMLNIRNTLVYPNPAKDSTNFTYVLSQEADVTTRIFSLSGATIKTLGPYTQTAGFNNILWDSKDEFNRLLASGSYLFEIKAINENGVKTKNGAFVILR
ncbi:MAG: C25 family cysteine peptidase [Candidatus Latescibacterota bacterium]|nr:C25 family cysteine peptidase [Candidatus Latescibacterota bacterium]